MRTVVVLGASNLTLGLPWVLRTLAGRGPMEARIALGPGRSYGSRAGIPLLRLAGIGDTRVLEAIPEGPVHALITDAGNDVLYGFPVPVITGWLEGIFEKLSRHQARVLVSGLPLESAARLTPARFRLLRTLLFPGNRMSLGETLAAARELDSRLRDLADLYQVRFATAPSNAYAADAIHIRPLRLGEVFGGWLEDVLEGAPRPPRRWRDVRLRFY